MLTNEDLDRLLEDMRGLHYYQIDVNQLRLLIDIARMVIKPPASQSSYSESEISAARKLIPGDCVSMVRSNLKRLQRIKQETLSEPVLDAVDVAEKEILQLMQSFQNGEPID